MSTDAASIWADLINNGPDLHRKFEHHPLRLYYGTDAAGRAMLLLIVDDRPETVRLGDAVLVKVGERLAQHEWSLVLSVQDPSMSDTFMDLCIDLAERSRAGKDEPEALVIFRSALEEFRDLLTFRSTRSLSLEALRGLIAELWFAVRVVTANSSALDAVVAWTGPLGSPQDFRLPDGSLVEVKAIHSEAREIRISSTEQLDPVELVPLELVTIGLEERAHPADGAVTVPGLVDEFRVGLAGNAHGLDELERRLKALGILGTYRELEASFDVTTPRHYSVRDGFPRIRRSDVSQGIERLRYEIKIKSMSEFEIYKSISPEED